MNDKTPIYSWVTPNFYTSTLIRYASKGMSWRKSIHSLGSATTVAILVSVGFSWIEGQQTKVWSMSPWHVGMWMFPSVKGQHQILE